MKKTLCLLLSLLIATSATAGVRMLGDSGSSDSSRRGYSSGSRGVSFKPQQSATYKASSGRQWCQENGYTETVCENGGVVVTCPRNSYFVHCCPPKYRFRKEFCESRGYIPSDDDCMGYHRCMAPAPVVPQNGK